MLLYRFSLNLCISLRSYSYTWFSIPSQRPNYLTILVWIFFSWELYFNKKYFFSACLKILRRHEDFQEHLPLFLKGCSNFWKGPDKNDIFLRNLPQKPPDHRHCNVTWPQSNGSCYWMSLNWILILNLPPTKKKPRSPIAWNQKAPSFVWGRCDSGSSLFFICPNAKERIATSSLYRALVFALLSLNC